MKIICALITGLDGRLVGANSMLGLLPQKNDVKKKKSTKPIEGREATMF